MLSMVRSVVSCCHGISADDRYSTGAAGKGEVKTRLQNIVMQLRVSRRQAVMSRTTLTCSRTRNVATTLTSLMELYVILILALAAEIETDSRGITTFRSLDLPSLLTST